MAVICVTFFREELLCLMLLKPQVVWQGFVQWTWHVIPRPLRFSFRHCILLLKLCGKFIKSHFPATFFCHFVVRKQFLPMAEQTPCNYNIWYTLKHTALSSQLYILLHALNTCNRLNSLWIIFLLHNILDNISLLKQCVLEQWIVITKASTPKLAPFESCS